MQQLKKIVKAFVNPQQLALLDYAIEPKPLYTKENPHTILEAFIAANKPAYRQLLEKSLAYQSVFSSIANTGSSIAPVWNNDFFPGLDIVLLYTILATEQPKQYLEIGSGTSTKVAAKAKAEQQLNCKITCIDPAPRSEIKSAANQWLNQPLQHIPVAVFEALEERDILFFDGSHLLHANSDVQWFFMEIVPRLKKGVIVQIHDIYLPYDYPQNMCDRFYAEQYMLATAILMNPSKFQVLAPAFYMSEDAELQAILQPLWNQLPTVEQHGGSFWFKIL